ncbi:hypothetical protein CRYUN_Cryun04dG0106300 [Craigia yunnanensis]
MDLVDPSALQPIWFTELFLQTAALDENLVSEPPLLVPYSFSDQRMEKIQHSHVEVRRLKLHAAVIGTGPKVVLFLHGFPEIWYSWSQRQTYGWTRANSSLKSQIHLLKVLKF